MDPLRHHHVRLHACLLLLSSHQETLFNGMLHRLPKPGRTCRKESTRSVATDQVFEFKPQAFSNKVDACITQDGITVAYYLSEIYCLNISSR